MTVKLYPLSYRGVLSLYPEIRYPPDALYHIQGRLPLILAYSDRTAQLYKAAGMYVLLQPLTFFRIHKQTDTYGVCVVSDIKLHKEKSPVLYFLFFVVLYLSSDRDITDLALYLRYGDSGLLHISPVYDIGIIRSLYSSAA